MAQRAVYLVEDDVAYVEAVKFTLAKHPDFLLTQSFSCADDVVLTQVSPNSIWLIDLGLPGVKSGLELIEPISDAGGLVLVNSVFEDETRVLAAIQKGAQGYYVKGDGNLLQTISMISQGQSPLSARVAAHLLKRLRKTDTQAKPLSLSNPLSPRELETLQALAYGSTYREIAQAHGVSHHTVGDHIKSIYRKLHVNSKTSAINWALSKGLVSIERR